MAGKPAGVVLITGCSSGIGHAAAIRLERGGHHVYATVHTRHDVDDLEVLGCDIRVLDLTDETSMIAVVAEIEQEHGGVGVLVNNAGFGVEAPVEEVPVDAMRDQFETNLFGPTRLTQLVLPGMRRRGRGRILNVSSVGGRITIPGGGAYHASKHALEALSDALRMEVRDFGIDVVVIEPGAIKSNWVEHAVSEMQRRRPDDTPYAGLYDAIEKRLRNADSGVLALTAGNADAAARVIEHAIATDRPRTRYVVPRTASLFIAARRFMPDRVWDLAMSRMYSTAADPP